MAREKVGKVLGGVPTILFRVYQDKAGGWRWRLVAENGRIVGDSGESYTRRRDVIRAAKRVGELVQSDLVGIEDEKGIGVGWCIPPVCGGKR